MDTSITPLKVEQLIHTLKYGLNPRNRFDFYIVSITLIIILAYIKSSSSLSLQGIFHQKTDSDMLGLILDGITVAAIVSVWISDLAKDWRNQLEKYLSVSFKFENETKLEETYIYLTDESDIRQMAQSLGQARNEGKRLPIKPSIQTMQKQILQDSSGIINEGKPFYHFNVSIELTKDITDPQEDAL